VGATGYLFQWCPLKDELLMYATRLNFEEATKEFLFSGILCIYTGFQMYLAIWSLSSMVESLLFSELR